MNSRSIVIGVSIKGPLKVSDHEFKITPISMAVCFSAATFCFKDTNKKSTES